MKVNNHHEARNSHNMDEFFIGKKNRKQFSDSFQKFVINNKDLQSCELYKGSSSKLYFPIKEIQKSKKNILLVSHELSRTGAPIVLLDAAKVLQKNGYFVTVIVLKEGPLLKDFLNIGIPVVVIPEMYKYWLFSNELSHFMSSLELDAFVEGFDTAIFNTATMYNFVRRYFNTDNKIIWWLHEGFEIYIRGEIAKRMPKNITPNIKVVCAGEYAVEKVRECGFKYYPEVLNYGVFDENPERKSKGIGENKVLHFLTVGTIEYRKGQDLLLEAIKLLPQEHRKRLEFLFVGKAISEPNKEIERRIKEAVKEYNNIKLFPPMPRDELFQLYKDIDVLVAPSTDDPMPVVATESLMLERVVLCSNHTGTSYYIENGINGFVFDSGNVEDLKNKIIEIVEKKDELDSIRLRGREIYDNNFRIEIFEKNLMNLVKERENYG